MGSEKQLIIDLAVDEGHDADIPTNAGRIQDNSSPTTVTSTASNFDKDIEKDAVSGRGSIISSRAESIIPNHDPKSQTEVDPNIVDWDGPDDPENPMNWSTGRKWGAIAVVSGITFLTPLGSSIFAPGVPLVMKEFNSSSTMLEGFIVSVYVLGFAFGPLSNFSLAILLCSILMRDQSLRRYQKCTADCLCTIHVTFSSSSSTSLALCAQV
jgi:hypothetical protein